MMQIFLFLSYEFALSNHLLYSGFQHFDVWSLTFKFDTDDVNSSLFSKQAWKIKNPLLVIRSQPLRANFYLGEGVSLEVQESKTENRA